MKRPSSAINRREFLGEANCAALGSTAVTAAILNLNLLGRLAAADEPDEEEDYRALVCLYLAGGNDSFNMVGPGSGDGYDEYAAARASVAIPAIGEEGGFLPLNGTVSDTDDRQLGIHPSLPYLQGLYNSGKAALVANVGTLVEPTSLEAFQNGTVKLPLGLFSHSDQMMQWQTSLPDQRSSRTGWGGRMSDLLQDLNEVSSVSMNISTAGENIFQTGGDTTSFAIGANGAIELTAWRSPSYANRRAAVESMLDLEYKNAFQRAFAERKQSAITANAAYKDALDGVTALETTFTSWNPLSVQFQNVAKTIGARQVLGKKRQTFFVLMPGYDLHGKLGTQHPALLATVDQALAEFQAALEELGVSGKVTTFTSSDFSRTLATNGSGTDHAWGGNHFVIGNAVEGGKVYGTYPELALESSIDTGRGRLIPSTSVDEYVSDLALWMGISKANLPMILPNLSRFHSPADGPAMGYMKGPA